MLSSVALLLGSAMAAGGDWVRRGTPGSVVHAWPVVIPQGATITDGMADDVAPITVTRPSWLFFVDVYPGALFEHPTQFVLVDQATNLATSYASLSYPVVSGVALFATPDQLSEPTLVVAGVATLEAPATLHALGWSPPTPVNTGYPTTPPPSTFERFSGETQPDFTRRYRGSLEAPQPLDVAQSELSNCPDCDGKAGGHRYALIVAGGQLSTTVPSELATFLRGQGWIVTYLAPAQADDPREMLPGFAQIATVPAVLGALADIGSKAQCCDEVFVVINAHGSPTGFLQLNPRQTIVPDATQPTITKTIGDPGAGSSPRAISRPRSTRSRPVASGCCSRAAMRASTWSPA